MSLHISLSSSPSVAAATEALKLAEQALDDALTFGGDTSAARVTWAVARDALAVATAAEKRAVDQTAAVKRAAAREEDAVAVQVARDDFVAAVSVIEPAPDADPLPTPAVPGIVLQATQQVQRAQRALIKAQKPFAAASQECSAVRARLSSKESALAEIRARRTGGDEQLGDPAEMTALSMDAEDLRRIVVGLQSNVDAAAPAVQAAQQAMLDAQQAVAAAKARAELDAMVDRVRAVEMHFVAQVRALRLAAQARGHVNFGSVFLPSQQLRMLAQGGRI
ncbi:hypothetical protein [Variovorax sp. YR566]|uniref:hypothetical protein n=1 Tax=Variovorax sp. YR566 TaxID=3450237 RepID=UPI003F7EBA8D